MHKKECITISSLPNTIQEILSKKPSKIYLILYMELHKEVLYIIFEML